MTVMKYKNDNANNKTGLVVLQTEIGLLIQAANLLIIFMAHIHWVGAKVHVTLCVDLYSGQILVFSMTLMRVCVLSSV